MSNESTLRSVQDNRAHIKRVFDHHCDKSSSVMRIEGLKDACEHSGLLAEVLSEAHGDEKAEKLCLNAMLSCMCDPPEARELDELVFAEFVHAACRIAVEVTTTSTRVEQKIMLG